VTEAIVELQRDFFEHGISYLRPLTLKDIAEKIEMHESTVSRVTSNKYAQTPRGVFELKYFFSSGFNASFGTQESAKAVKSRIKEMIDGEDKAKPLSDQKITDMLCQQGIDISRRTVQKYREELNIAASSKRKRF
jgi:RNA polymerase sigma-54 factor